MSAQNSDAGPLGDLYPYKEQYEIFSQIPQRGRDFEDVYDELQAIITIENEKWTEGQVSGTYYHGGLEHYDKLNKIFSLFSYVNLLQRDLCPSGTKFEGEILSMVAKMLNGEAVKEINPDDEVCGSITSGGTESILNAMLVYREWGREKGITQPEFVAPQTIHPAFEKGAHYLGIKLIRVPVKPDFEADVETMRSQITPNTIALAGSAGNYPHGVIDPLAELSQLALERQIGMHVDGCLGGFILPWIEKLGYDIPVFDFRLPGVTSMSCDTHKFGYALKGTSAVLYRNKKLRRFQYYSNSDWEGGVYASPTFQGSRSGGLSAATWAALVMTGEQGYLEMAQAIMTAADTIRAGITQIPELKILGKSTFVIAVASDVVDIYQVNDYLASKGWRMNGCQNPPGFHFCVTLRQGQPGVAERYVEDLRAAVEYAKDPPSPFPTSGAIYGLAGTLEGQTMLKQLILEWLDATYSLPG